MWSSLSSPNLSPRYLGRVLMLPVVNKLRSIVSLPVAGSQKGSLPHQPQPLTNSSFPTGNAHNPRPRPRAPAASRPRPRRASSRARHPRLDPPPSGIIFSAVCPTRHRPGPSCALGPSGKSITAIPPGSSYVGQQPSPHHTRYIPKGCDQSAGSRSSAGRWGLATTVPLRIELGDGVVSVKKRRLIIERRYGVKAHAKTLMELRCRQGGQGGDEVVRRADAVGPRREDGSGAHARWEG